MLSLTFSALLKHPNLTTLEPDGPLAGLGAFVFSRPAAPKAPKFPKRNACQPPGLDLETVQAGQKRP